MHKIDTDTAVGNEFVDGNAAASIRATRLNAKWFNTIQRELCNIVTKAGMALSKSDDGQVLVAILAHAITEILGGKFHDGELKLGGENSANSVLRDRGIWFEYPDSKAHIFLTEEGFGFHFYDENDNFIEISLNKDGLVCVFYDEKGSPVNVSLNKEELQIGSDIHVKREGLSQLKGLHILDNLNVDGKLSVQGVVRMDDDAVRLLKSLILLKDLRFVSGSAESLAVTDFVQAKYFRAAIYDAESTSMLRDPSSLLVGIAYFGSTARVRNMTGEKFVLERLADGNQRAYLVVDPGEILQFVYDGSKWVHSW